MEFALNHVVEDNLNNKENVLMEMIAREKVSE